jgi:hypothetical protein
MDMATAASEAFLPLQLQCISCCRVEKELKPGEDQPLLQPMAVAPLRHTTGAAISSSVLPPRLLIVDVMSASSNAGAAEDGSLAETDRQLLVSVQLTTGGQPHAAGKRVPSKFCCAEALQGCHKQHGRV